MDALQRSIAQPWRMLVIIEGRGFKAIACPSHHLAIDTAPHPFCVQSQRQHRRQQQRQPPAQGNHNDDGDDCTVTLDSATSAFDSEAWQRGRAAAMACAEDTVQQLMTQEAGQDIDGAACNSGKYNGGNECSADHQRLHVVLLDDNMHFRREDKYFVSCVAWQTLIF